MRLPTEAEWEHAAAASHVRPDGASDPAWRTELLSIYSRPLPARLPRVGADAPNFWGVNDMHGVVWEWVSDFSAAVASFASGSDRMRFCGATAANATDATDFAAFERAAFRSSLHANYTIRSLGFRCAADVNEGAAR
jgi:formylglycine-generating enzyme required for sulfatase activity